MRADAQGPEAVHISLLRATFLELFRPPQDAAFDDQLFAGYYDSAEGVQWQVALEVGAGVAWLGVNLEGIAYKGVRPLAAVILAELDLPQIFDLREQVSDAERVRIHLTKDAWQGRKRPAIEHRHLLAPVMLAHLKPTGWRGGLLRAKDCLPGPDGKAPVQPVHLVGSGKGPSLRITPHLNFGVRLWNGPAPTEDLRRREMSRARAILEPVHEWLTDRSSGSG